MGEGDGKDYELDKVKIKKSSDRLAKRARNCKFYYFNILFSNDLAVNTSQLGKPQNAMDESE